MRVWLLALAVACGDKEAAAPSGGDEDGGSDDSFDVDGDGDGYFATEDCNDGDPGIHPGAVEICDDIDNNCDGVVDEGVINTYYADSDGDGHGNADDVLEDCDEPRNYTTVAGDCDDLNAEVHPGADERCNSLDDDCNGTIDDQGGCVGCEVATSDSSQYLMCTLIADWEFAMRSCDNYGYGPLRIDDADEQSWLMEHLSALGEREWWLGLSDAAEEGRFAWTDGTTAAYTNWCGEEPDNEHPGECTGDSTANCAVIDPAADGCWTDFACECARAYYICELTL